MALWKRSSTGACGVFRASLASTVAVGLGVCLAPAVHAAEVDDLIAQLESVSQQASAKNEEVKALEIAIADNEFKLTQATALVADAQAAVESAQAALDELKENSGALANTSVNDVISAGLDGLSSISDQVESAQLLADLKSANAESADIVYATLKQAQEAQESASRALAVETFRKDELKFQHDQVLEEQADLNRTSEALKAQVDAFSPEQLAAWVNKNNPISQVEVEQIVQELPVPVAEIISNPVVVEPIQDIAEDDLAMSLADSTSTVVKTVTEVISPATEESSEVPDTPTSEAEQAKDPKENEGLGSALSGLPASANDGAVSAALSKVGSPYQWGGTGPDSFDCSGLMVWAFQQIGKVIPRTSYSQIGSGQSIPANLASLIPGDIIAYYDGASHVGMYIGDGKIVHASDYGIPVQVVAWDSMPVYGATRY